MLRLRSVGSHYRDSVNSEHFCVGAGVVISESNEYHLGRTHLILPLSVCTTKGLYQTTLTKARVP